MGRHRKHTKWKRGKKIMMVIGIIIGAVLVLICLTLVVVNYRTEGRPQNQVFKNGQYPSQTLDGEYRGSYGGESDWKGKKFDATNQTGINLFGENKEERYVFKTYQAKSLKGDRQVLKIDYDQPGNPWWLHFIVDELVEVAPGDYQGKVYAKVGPVVVTITYFKLLK